MEKEARTKLADKNIVWTESYTDRTEQLKKQFDEVVGPGSYFRFEGKEGESGDEYYVIVAPAKIHDPEAKFFAGVRKLPSDYAAGGQYFPTLKEAMEYAVATWGVKTPSDINYYDASDLKGIAKRIEDWKEDRDAGVENGDEDDEVKSASVRFVRTSWAPYYMQVEAFGTPRSERTGFLWFDLDSVVAGESREFESYANRLPPLRAAASVALDERANRRRLVAKLYGEHNVEADFYKIWLSFNPQTSEMYWISIGPYLPKSLSQQLASPEQARQIGMGIGQGLPVTKNFLFDDAGRPLGIDKFSAFYKKLHLASQEELEEYADELISDYAEKWGVQLTRDDLMIPEDPKKRINPTITLSKSGKDKLYRSPEWKRQILDYYGVQPDMSKPDPYHGLETKLKEERKKRIVDYKRQLDEAYARSQESGDAFKMQQPAPPSVSMDKSAKGQQQPTAIWQGRSRKEEGMSDAEMAVRYGFNSVPEAVDYLVTHVWEGVPLGDVPTTTSEDLKNARERQATQVGQEAPPSAEVQEDGQIGAKETAAQTPEVPAEITEQVPEETKEQAPVKAPVQAPVKVPAKTRVPEPVSLKSKKTIEKAPEKAPDKAPAQTAKPDLSFQHVNEYDEIFGAVKDTVRNLVKLAARFDEEGKGEEAEEIHKILRKHVLTPDKNSKPEVK